MTDPDAQDGVRAERVAPAAPPGPPFTPEQRLAIERRGGDLLLDAGAGSGKTTVLVERFARAVREDGVDVAAILTITFTEKAAAELRERIRARLRALGDDDAARATEGAWISTIHAFCARVLRAHALSAGLDPGFTVLEPTDADELAGRAFDEALGAVAATPPGAELVAGHGPWALRAAILAVHTELRSRGLRRPSLPPLPSAGDAQALARARAAALTAARAAAAELGAIPDPAVRVGQALRALERAETVLAADNVWPGDLGGIGLPARNGAAALKSDACDEYRTALEALGTLAARGLAGDTRDALDALLMAFADRYTALKAERSAVDFEDLELIARDVLSRPEIGARYRARFAHVMVDELQDTNRVQMEIVDLVSGGEARLFMVGDAQQSIYGFRHAEVELFEQRGRRLGAVGARASLQTNFRTRPEILRAINGAFEVALGERFRALVPGRTDPPAHEPLVELLVVDKAADWDEDGLAAPWRLAEARVLAARVAALVGAGACAAGDVVVLTRATTDLRAYERALEAAGVPTYVIGGRGYWGHPQVVEMLGYLRALANPLDAEAWYGTLLSPLCGLSLDGLVLLAAGAREELDADDVRRLAVFEAWFAAERAAAARTGVEDLIDRAMERTGYDATVLAMPGGRRRLANVRKLMRLGREWEARAGSDLPGFLRFVGLRGGAAGGAGGGGGAGAGTGAASRESEAPVESEGLDAVRLMTIHRAKGLEFPVTCVADLGRSLTFRADLIRIGRDGVRLGLRLARPGTGARVNALDYEALRQEAIEADEAEERRLFYVAATRAKERLILSGAAKLDTWEKGNRSTPIDWIGSAFVPDIASRVAEPTFVSDRGVRVTFVGGAPTAAGAAGAASPPSALGGAGAGSPPSALGGAGAGSPPSAPGAADFSQEGPQSGPSPATLSYSALAEYERCGYRYYVERVLGLPPVEEAAGGTAPDLRRAEPAAALPGARTEVSGATVPPTLPGAERGTLVHRLLQDADLARDDLALDVSGVPREVAALVEAFAASPVRERLAAASDVRREQRFAFPHPAAPATLVTGTFDVLAREGDGLLVVDYKTDRLAAADPVAVTETAYGAQRLVYAVAALRSGASAVEVVHLFLEVPDRPVSVVHTAADLPALEARLTARAAPLLEGRFPVTDEPHRGICGGCPAAGGLCSWPLETAMRPTTDRLF